MARRLVHGLAQLLRPFSDGDRALARHIQAVFGRAAIGGDGRAEALGQRPFQHFGRIGGELQLQQLAPHLFLAAAQVDEIVDERQGHGEEAAAKGHQLVHRVAHGGAAPEIIAEIDDAVARLDALGDLPMERGQTRGFAVDGGHRPDAAGHLRWRPAQGGENGAIRHDAENPSSKMRASHRGR